MSIGENSTLINEYQTLVAILNAKGISSQADITNRVVTCQNDVQEVVDHLEQQYGFLFDALRAITDHTKHDVVNMLWGDQ